MADAAKSLDIVINTRTELKGAEQAAEALEKQIGAAKAAGKNYDDLQAKLDRARAAISKFKAENPDGGGEAWRALNQELVQLFPVLGKLESVLLKLGTGTIGLILVAVAGLVSMFSSAKRALSEFSSAQDVWAKLDTSLAQSGLLTDGFRKKLSDLAAEMQKSTGIADEEWLGVFSRLISFGADEGNIDTVAKAVENLAGIMGGDLAHASTLVSRAINGQFEGFSRYGIIIDESAKQADKLKSLWEQLAQRGGGQLAAQTQTINGQFQRLRNNISDIFEGIGAWINQNSTLQATIAQVANAAGWVAEKLSYLMPSLKGLRNQMQDAAKAVMEAEHAMKRQEEQVIRTKNAVDALVKSYDAQKQAQEELQKLNMDEIAAREKLELAKVDTLEKRGKISKVTAAFMRAGVTERFAKERSAVEKKGEDEAISNHQNFLEQSGVEEQRRVGLINAQRARVELAKKIKDTVLELNQARASGAPVEMLKQRLQSLQSMIPVTKDAYGKPKQVLGTVNAEELYLKNLEDDLSKYQSQITPEAEKRRQDIESIKHKQTSRVRVETFESQTRALGRFSDVETAISDQRKEELEAIKSGQAIRVQINQTLSEQLVLSRTTDKQTLAIIQELVRNQAEMKREFEMLNKRGGALRNR